MYMHMYMYVYMYICIYIYIYITKAEEFSLFVCPNTLTCVTRPIWET